MAAVHSNYHRLFTPLGNPSQAYRKKMEAELPENDCCLCRAHFRGYGNNPEPIVDHGVACDECDRKLVMVARLQSACKARQ